MFAPVVSCSQNVQQNAVKEPKTFDPAVYNFRNKVRNVMTYNKRI